MLIFVVDDEVDILRTLEFRLKKVGYEVVLFKDGKSALEAVYNKKPDLILLDIQLPGIDGYEFCRIAKSDPEIKEIPIIFLTATRKSDVAEKTRELGAEDYLIKPFEVQELLAKMEKHIVKKREGNVV